MLERLAGSLYTDRCVSRLILVRRWVPFICTRVGCPICRCAESLICSSITRLICTCVIWFKFGMFVVSLAYISVIGISCTSVIGLGCTSTVDQIVYL